jgi:glycosyltransferase involved in cell wall biosynthesis
MAHLARLLNARGYQVEIIAQSDGDDEFCHLDAHGNLVHRIVAGQSYLMKALSAIAPRPLHPYLWLGNLPFAVRVLEKVFELTRLWGRQILWIETTNWKAQTFLLHVLPSLNQRCIVRIVTPMAEVAQQNGAHRGDRNLREALLQELLQQLLLQHRFYSNADYKPWFESRVRFERRAAQKEEVFLLPFDFDRVPERAAGAGSSDGTVRLLMLGRIEPRKGFEELLEALAALAPAERARLRVLAAGRDTTEGGQSYTRHLRKRFGAVSDHVEFLGEVPEAELPALFARADVGLMASRSESFGYNLLELLAADLPVLSADVGAASELERRGVRYLVKYRGTGELGAALATLPERLAAYQSSPPANRRALAAIYRKNDDDYLAYTRRFVPPEHAPNGHHHDVPAPVRSVDLVVCSYDRFDDLTLALDSLLGETRRAHDTGLECRLTVVYQNEDLPEKLRARRPELANEPLLRLLPSFPPSLTRARNHAVESTTGDLLIFVDDDVVLEPGFVLAHVEAANRHPRAAGVVGHIKTGQTLPAWPNGRRAVGQIRASGHIETHFDSEERRATLVPLTPMGANMSFRREVMNGLFGARWFDERFGGSAFREESTIAIWIFRRGHHLVFAPDAALHHYESTTGGCNNRASRTLDQWVAHYQLNYLYLNNLFAPDERLRLGVPLLHVARDLYQARGLRERLRLGYIGLKAYAGGRRLFSRG